MANTISRAMHDLGLAGWFGGTLANAVALNPAAAEAGDVSSTGRVVNAGWDRWAPVNGAAIAVHLVGSLGQLAGNRSRLTTQEGVASMALVKSGLTAAALGATVYSRMLGLKVSAHHSTPAQSGTTPDPSTPDDVAAAQKQLAAMQWVIPALTGALVLVSAYAGEQQRPSEVRKGIVGRYTR